MSKYEAKDSRLVWVDLEMTGLDTDKDTILEMACIISDAELNIIDQKGSLIVHQPDDVLDRMGDWCKEHHGSSGLTAAVKASKFSMAEVEDEMLKFIQSYTNPGKCLLAGNSVGADKKFLDKYMPRFSEHLHYRIVDVSTVKELCRRWYPDAFPNAPKKALNHRALDDIKESIEELKFYRNSIFK